MINFSLFLHHHRCWYQSQSDDLRIEIALSYNMKILPWHQATRKKVKSLFHQQLNRERFYLVSSPESCLSSFILYFVALLEMIKLLPYQNFFLLASSSLCFHHKIYILHDDDYVVTALPFDDVTDNLSLIRKIRKRKREWASER